LVNKHDVIVTKGNQSWNFMIYPSMSECNISDDLYHTSLYLSV